MSKKVALVTLFICLFICLGFCKRGKTLSGKYVCTSPDNSSYFLFLPGANVRYRDNNLYPTYYFFRYEVKGNSVKLIGENASYNLKLTKNGEIVVSKGRYFFKNMLVYKKNYFKHK